MKQRYEQLLKKTISELECGMSPLNHEFLVRNNVSVEECRDLINLIIEAIYVYIHHSITKEGNES